MDYAVPERRKNRNDRKAKARFNRFKIGGAQRTQVFSSTPFKNKEKK